MTYIKTGHCTEQPRESSKPTYRRRNDHCPHSRSGCEILTAETRRRKYQKDITEVARARLNTDTGTERVRSECDNNTSSVGESKTVRPEPAAQPEVSTEKEPNTVIPQKLEDGIQNADEEDEEGSSEDYDSESWDEVEQTFSTGVREVSLINVKDDNPTKPAWRWLPQAEGDTFLKKLQIPVSWWLTKHWRCVAMSLALPPKSHNNFIEKNGGPPTTKRHASRSILRPGIRESNAKHSLRVVSGLPGYARESGLGTRKPGIGLSKRVAHNGYYKHISDPMSPPEHMRQAKTRSKDIFQTAMEGRSTSLHG